MGRGSLKLRTGGCDFDFLQSQGGWGDQSLWGGEGIGLYVRGWSSAWQRRGGDGGRGVVSSDGEERPEGEENKSSNGDRMAMKRSRGGELGTRRRAETGEGGGGEKGP
eukprot:752090-Hanusia_phi.AAC.1